MWSLAQWPTLHLVNPFNINLILTKVNQVPPNPTFEVISSSQDNGSTKIECNIGILGNNII